MKKRKNTTKPSSQQCPQQSSGERVESLHEQQQQPPMQQFSHHISNIISFVLILLTLLMAIVHRLLKETISLLTYCRDKLLRPDRCRRKASTKVQYYIQSQGYQCEEHQVVTEDGHILTLFRVCGRGPDSRKNDKDEFNADIGESRQPVLLQHGILQSSGVFVCNEENSLAFVLARAGFDVWLGNSRGTYHGHTTYTSDHPEYWNFTIDHLSKYDIPALIDYIRDRTKFDKIHFVGHSQGTCQMFMALSSIPELNDKVALFVALAPALFVPPFKFPLSILSAPSSVFDNLFGQTRFLPFIYLSRRLLPRKLFTMLAYNIMNFVFGWDDDNWVWKNKPQYFSFSPVPTSTRLLRHWAVIATTGRFRAFGDGSLDPTVTEFDYPLHNIRSPIALFYGTKDQLCIGDVASRMCSENSLDVVLDREIEDYDHVCFIWGSNAKEKVYNDLVDICNRYSCSLGMDADKESLKSGLTYESTVCDSAVDLESLVN